MLARVDIRAPQDGTVHEMSVHTVGGVVAPGEAMMMIVPVGDTLDVEARIAPRMIDQVHVGQTAVLRFSAFNQRTTPEIDGKVTLVSRPTSFRIPRIPRPAKATTPCASPFRRSSCET